MKNYIYILFLVISFFFGCTSEFLEEAHPTQRTSDDFFTKDSDAQEAVVGLYEYVNKNMYGTNLDLFAGAFDMLRGDELILPKKFRTNAIVPWLTLNYDPENGRVRDAWRSSYEVIYRANWIIDNVTDNSSISDAVKKQALSEAYFIRGFSYFNLTRLFEEVPLVLTRTTPETYFPTKASNEECWNQVISDFQKSLDLGGLTAPTENFMNGRVNTGVVHSIMARAYLYQTRPGSNLYWDKVKAHTQAVEDLNKYTLEPLQNFSRLFVYTKEDNWVKNKEVIWGAGNIYGPIYGGTPFMYDNQSFITYSTMPVNYTTTIVYNENREPFLPANGRTGRALYALSPVLSDIMLDYYSKGDNRTGEYLYYPTFNHYVLETATDFNSVKLKQTVDADALYQEVKNTEGASGEYLHIKKFLIREFIGTNIWDGGYNHSLVYPIVRYADILLMRAEAEFHLGNEGVAKSYLKRITDRAGFDQDYANQFSGQALIDEILKQRRVELMFESLRVPDLIRLNQFKPPYVGTYPGSVTWNEKYRVLPIPQRELDLNKNLVQHELWR